MKRRSPVRCSLSGIRWKVLALMFLLCGLPCVAVHASSQLPDFVYQGQLQQNGQPANGTFDLEFALFNAATGGSQVGGTIVDNTFPITGGLFTVSLAFPGAFTGTQLWLRVRVNGTTMSPRTAVATVPVAQYSLSGAIANGSITNAMLATDSVSRTRILGSNKDGHVSFTIAGSDCQVLTFNVSGAAIGDIVVMNWAEGVTPPTNILIGPASVVATSSIKAPVCNLGTSSYTNPSIPITVQTFR
jgi:hypothetical protein